MASNKVRSSLIHKMMCKVRSIGGIAISVEIDPLGRRYEVNKHTLNIEYDNRFDHGKYNQLVQLAKTVIEELTTEGWVLVDQYTVKSGDAIIKIDVPSKPPEGYPLGMNLYVR